MEFFGRVGARGVVAITALCMTACQAQNPAADSKGFGGQDDATIRQQAGYISQHCSELGIGRADKAGNKIISRTYSYEVPDSATGLGCKIPVKITRRGRDYMTRKGVTCDYVETAEGVVTGELQLRNLSTHKPYHGINIFCDTAKVIIDGETRGNQDRLVIKVRDNVPYYPDALKQVLASIQGGDNPNNANGNSPQVTDVTDSIDAFQKVLGADKKTLEGYAEAVQAMRLMYITDDYLENTYKQTASQAMTKILDDISTGKVTIGEHRTVESSLVYGMDEDFFALTRWFYNRFNRDPNKEDAWFIEVKQIGSVGDDSEEDDGDNGW